MMVSAGLVVGGAGNVAAGIRGLTQAMMSKGSGSSGSSKIDPTKPANEVLLGSLRREFPGQHLNKSLNEIKELLRTASGEEKRSLQTAKKLLEQSERLLEKTKNK
jgi:hypothetical protein